MAMLCVISQVSTGVPVQTSAQPGARHEEYEVTEILSAGQPIITWWTLFITWWTKCQKEDSHNDSAVIVTACICRQL